jgi:hypothetical protein
MTEEKKSGSQLRWYPTLIFCDMLLNILLKKGRKKNIKQKLGDINLTNLSTKCRSTQMDDMKIKNNTNRL